MSTAKKILAVDDENDVLLIIKTALVSEGFEVKTASGGTDALAIAPEFQPDLVIVYMMMPEMTGFEVLAWLREQPFGVDLPVIVLSGSDQQSDQQRAQELGAGEFLVKPITAPCLAARLKQLAPVGSGA